MDNQALFRESYIQKNFTNALSNLKYFIKKMLSKKRNILLIRFPCNSVSLSRPSFSTKRFERLALGRGIRLDGSTETEMHDTRLNRRGWVAVTSVASVSSVCQIRGGREGRKGGSRIRDNLPRKGRQTRSFHGFPTNCEKNDVLSV